MYTTDLSGGVVAHHHGDMSGDIDLTFWGKAEYSHRAYIIDENGFQNRNPIGDTVMVKLSFADIRKLYLGHIRREKISKLEQMSDEEFERLIEGC